MKKFYLIVLGAISVFGLNANAQITLSDITPTKFDFSTYNVGPLTDFWNVTKQVNHATAGSATDANGVIACAQAANFGDTGFSYFYFNQPASPNEFTSIVDVDGIKCLQVGDSGHGAGFGGFYLVPVLEQVSGPMRTTFICRLTDGKNGSNTGASLNVGVRDIAAAGPDLPSVSNTDLRDSSKAGKWYKFVIEYNPTYALRVNFAQLIWGDNIQIAQVMFETMSNVPEGYEFVKSVTQIATDEISSGTTAITDIDVDTAGNQEYYNVFGQKVSAGYKGIVISKGHKFYKR